MATADNAIQGTWYIAKPGGTTDQITFTFLADGTFLVADKGNPSGIEWGTYTWNAATGAFSYTVSINTDGTSGMSDASITSVKINGDTLVLSTKSEGDFSATRVTTPGKSIVGSWYAANPGGGTDQIVFTFLSDGTFLVADKGTPARDPSGTSGIEWGTYTWNAATGALAISVQVNTDREWGLSHSGITSATVTADGKLSMGGLALTSLSTTASSTPTTPAPATSTGTAGADRLVGTTGNDSFDGGAGVDVVAYSGARSAYTLTKTSTGFTVASSAEGTDTMVNVERLSFSDTKLALDLAGNAGTVAKTLGAVFGAASVANKAFVGIGLTLADGGMSYANLAQLAINAKLGAVHTHKDVVDLLYTNVVGTAPSAEAQASFVALLDNGTFTEGSLGVLGADFSLNQSRINLVGLASTGLEYA